MVLHALASLIDPKLYQRIRDRLSDRSIALSVDGIQSPQQSSRCENRQGSQLLSVHFGLVCAVTLKYLPSGASYRDDCSWAIPFSLPQLHQRDSYCSLDAVKDRFNRQVLSFETGKLMVVFISRNT
jgi:hypothetical protein